MNITNRLKIKAWQAKTFGKPPEYVLKTKCPICGSELMISDDEMNKYTDRAIEVGKYVAKAHNPKEALINLPKLKAGIWLWWMCSNENCEFNGDEISTKEENKPNRR